MFHALTCSGTFIDGSNSKHIMSIVGGPVKGCRCFVMHNRRGGYKMKEGHIELWGVDL